MSSPTSAETSFPSQSINDQVNLIKTTVKKNKTKAECTLEKYGQPAPVEKSLNLLYSKCLPHDKYGNVDEKELAKLINACRQGRMPEMNEVKMAGELLLHSPCTTTTLDLFGPFKPEFHVKSPPKVDSDEVGSELVDLYWRAQLRDLPYSQWTADNKLIRGAIKDLKKCGDAYKAQKPITVQNLFRGVGQGLDNGDLISQFIWLPFDCGSIHIDQKHTMPASPGVNYVSGVKEYLSCQNGTVLEKANTDNLLPPSYIITPRQGSWAVHTDYPVSWAINTSLILSQLGCPWNILNPFSKPKVDANNAKDSKNVGTNKSVKIGDIKLPDNFYIDNEFNFIDQGLIDCHDLIGRAARLVLNCTWYNKWNYFRLRPGDAAYLVHLNKTGKQYRFKDCPEMPSVVLDSKILKRTYKQQGTYLLSQVYPESNPAHSSAPCGHCTFAAATLTIVKAFFDSSWKFKAQTPSEDGQSLIPTDNEVRVDNEINKLIWNIALHRDTAGVHYLSDSLLGIPMAEAVAKSILEDCVKRYQYASGFRYRNMNGDLVVITNFNTNTRYKELIKSKEKKDYKKIEKDNGDENKGDESNGGNTDNNNDDNNGDDHSASENKNDNADDDNNDNNNGDDGNDGSDNSKDGKTDNNNSDKKKKKKCKKHQNKKRKFKALK